MKARRRLVGLNTNERRWIDKGMIELSLQFRDLI
jgi:hypothetical protein